MKRASLATMALALSILTAAPATASTETTDIYGTTPSCSVPGVDGPFGTARFRLNDGVISAVIRLSGAEPNTSHHALLYGGGCNEIQDAPFMTDEHGHARVKLRTTTGFTCNFRVRIVDNDEYQSLPAFPCGQ
jgi:hypothetical protein